MLELLLLEEGNHEDAAIVGANDRGGRVFVLEDHVCRHLLICEEETELARVVELLEDLRIEVDERVGDVGLARLRLRTEQGKIADVH